MIYNDMAPQPPSPICKNFNINRKKKNEMKIM